MLMTSTNSTTPPSSPTGAEATTGYSKSYRVSSLRLKSSSNQEELSKLAAKWDEERKGLPSIKEDRKELKQAINDLFAQTNERNWDGEDADPVSKEALESALESVDSLPRGVRDPEIDATPRGEINFDWISGRNAMLSLGFCPDGSLAWSARFEDYNCRGSATWRGGRLPSPLEGCLEKFSQ